jgi:hypothetical protein
MLKDIGYCREDGWTDKHTEIQQARIERNENHHHLHRQNNPFFAIAFLRRFCQICHPVFTSLDLVTTILLWETKIRQIYEVIKVK